ncbi:MAG: hypothetical protein Q8R74_03130 [Methylophilus sp.]|nr:hypothetical protein [Methylophilus sp.]
MSNTKIKQILDQIAELECQLSEVINQEQTEVIFHFVGKKIEFEQSIKRYHLKLKNNFFHWLVSNRPLNLITGPIIYSMIIPLVITDFFITFYQITCFPIYGINKVNRSDYIVFDRQHLHYLNFIEKFHCTYCAYGSGMIAYISEIVARTEQYFCPIKHARKVLGTHARYKHFLEFGAAQDYQANLESYRKRLSKP